MQQPELTSKKWIVLIASSIGLIAVGAIFYFYNPSEGGFFLKCPLKLATGYHCPGCGSQRAIHQLFHGNLWAAFRLNPFMVVTLPLIIYALGLRVYNYIFETQHRVMLFYNKFFIYGYFGFALVYWVLRNLPYYPFNLLAPTQ